MRVQAQVQPRRPLFDATQQQVFDGVEGDRPQLDGLARSGSEKMRDGVPPDDPAALELAEEHRLHIDRWFYPCSPQMHAGLAEMYVSDPRFTATFDAVADGLAVYLRDAISRRAGSSSSA